MSCRKLLAAVVVLCVCLTAVSARSQLRHRVRATKDADDYVTVSSNYDMDKPSTRPALSGPTITVITTQNANDHEKKALEPAAEPNKQPVRRERAQIVSKTPKHKHDSQKTLAPEPKPVEDDVEKIVDKHVEAEEEQEPEQEPEQGEDEQEPEEEEEPSDAEVKGHLKHVHRKVKELLDKVHSNAKDIDEIKKTLEEEEEQEPDEAQAPEEEEEAEAEEEEEEPEEEPEEEEEAPEEEAAPEEEEDVAEAEAESSVELEPAE